MGATTDTGAARPGRWGRGWRRAWAAGRGGWRRLTRWLTRPAGLLSAGLGWQSLLFALAATCAFYVAANAWLCSRVDEAYASATLPALRDAADSRQAAEVALRLTGGDPRLRKDLREVLAPAQGPRPASEQLRALFARAADGAGSDEYAGLLRDFGTGRRRGVGYFLVSSRPASGEEVLEALERPGGRWLKGLEATGKAAEWRPVLARFADLTFREVQGPLRRLALINGWVQFLTVFVFWLTVGCVLRRVFLLRRLRAEIAAGTGEGLQEVLKLVAPPAGDAAGPAGRQQLVRDGFARLRGTLESSAYGTHGFLLGALPSLGFVGTVVGMGDALLAAEGLFSLRDKQRAVGDITRHLGYAFDTTLVGLVAALLAGALVVWQRVRESRLLRECESALAGGEPG